MTMIRENSSASKAYKPLKHVKDLTFFLFFSRKKTIWYFFQENEIN